MEIKRIFFTVVAGIFLLLAFVACSDGGDGGNTEPETTKYTVTLYTAVGEEPTTVSLESGKSLSAAINPAKEGYDFKGWFTADGTDYTGKAVTGDVTLFAYFVKTTTTISEDKKTTTTTTNEVGADSYESEKIEKVTTKEDGSKVTETTEKAVKSDGTKIEAESTKTENADGSSSESSKTTVTNADKSTIVTETESETTADGKTTSDTIVTKTDSEGNQTSKTETTVAADGTVTTKTTDAEGNEKPEEETPGENTGLKTYTITFYANDGSANPAKVTQTFKTGANVGVLTKLRKNTFEREGYVFIGWSKYSDITAEIKYQTTSTDGFSAYYDLSRNGDSVQLWATDEEKLPLYAGDKTLYAVWGPKKVYLTYDANVGFDSEAIFTYDGTRNGEKVAMTATKRSSIMDADKPVTLRTVQKLGLSSSAEFVGWTTALGGSVEYADGAEVTLPWKDVCTKITLYACYKGAMAITKDNVATVIASLGANTTSIIKLSGEISATTISAIRTAMRNNSSAYIALDLSETRGLTELNKSSGAYFEDCANMISIILPETVVSIGTKAFNNCRGLTEIEIPASVQTIGDGAFGYCSGLTKITLHEGLTTLDAGAFKSCTKLAEVTIPASVTSLGNAFWGCMALEKIAIASGNTSYTEEDGIIYSADKTKLVIYPVTKTEKSFTVPSTVTEIGKYAFCKSKLESLTVPAEVTSFGEKPFQEMPSLTEITFLGTKSFDIQEFYGCNNLKVISLHGGGISYAALDGNRKLETLNLGSEVTRFYIPDTVSVSVYDCPSLKEINVDGANQKYSSTLGILYNKDYSVLIRVPEAMVLPTNWEIQECVETIGANAFAGSTVSAITIPATVKKIGKFAFSQSKLTSVEFTDSDSIWYQTDSSNYTNGTKIGAMSADDAEENAKKLKSTYDYYYLYKDSN